jgi:anthraniloyl-CoA monooxygenase
MKIAVVGGGPGGLYLAALVKQLAPEAEIKVWERNAPDDTFGFGVVFSDQTLSGIKASDPSAFTEMGESFAYWDDVDVEYRGKRTSIGGNGFAAMSRVELLRVLQRRAAAAGVDVLYQTDAPPVEELMADYDLVVGCDGINSAIREKYSAEFGTSIDWRKCKFMWLGTDLVFDAFKFFVQETEWGTMQVHGYPMDANASTFIVEMHEDVWHKAGFDSVDAALLPPGVSDVDSIARVKEIFSGVLQGHSLVANNSKWVTFRTIRNATLAHKNLVLLGDAAHTAHFSIGSGTKLAMEDSLALAACILEYPTMAEAIKAYDVERLPVIKSTQRSAQASLEWWEELGQYTGQDFEQFVFNLMTRSRRITYDNLKSRDPNFVAEVDRWLLESEIARGRVPAGTSACPPMFLPFKLRDLILPNRVVVSAMDMYSATEGLPGDFHLVHLGSRALGGAGLVMTEMVCISADARITPGCGGIWTDEQESAWQRIVEFGHTTSAKMGIQLGHAGRKGSTKLMWVGIDQPLESGNWPLISASAIPYSPVNQIPRQMNRSDMDEVLKDFVSAAERGARAGFDLLELHCAHGYLLSSFLTSVSNQREDEYGGSIANRLRFPLEVFDAIREVWPVERPISVRISATDWVEDGLSADESIAIATAFAEHGADIIDVSTGQTSSAANPDYGRSYQTPYSDRIRNQVGVATIAVGSISSWDDVNTIIAAGRADLCALGRPHLYDPAWTLHAASDQEVKVAWPVQYRAGRRKPPAGRDEDPKPRLELVAPDVTAKRPSRWKP